MSTMPYKIAHQVLPLRAGQDPVALWDALSGPEWSMWLAMIGQVLGEPVRGVGVEGVLTGSAVRTVDGVEMLAVYFPEPAGPGEPFYAVLARRAGTATLRSFVFEKGIPEPAAPVRVVMAEWRTQGDSTMRLRYDVETDPSVAACLRRAAGVFNESAATAPVASAPSAKSTPYQTPHTAARPYAEKSSLAGILVAVFAVLFVFGMVWFFFIA